MDMQSSQNRSDCTFRCVFLRLATTSTAKSGLSSKNGEIVKPAKIKLAEIILQISDRIGHRKSVYCKNRECL